VKQISFQGQQLGLLSALLLLQALFVSAQTKPDLHNELLQMVERDQAARVACSNGTADLQLACYAKVGEEIDKPNTKRLNQIFNEHGFPSSKLVGADGVGAFLLMLQHSGDPSLKQKCRKGIEQAYREKALSVMDFTNFIDRLLADQGKLQVYGSYFAIKDGKFVMYPTKDVANLDKRRKKIGLPPIAEHMKMMKEFYKLDVVMHE